MEDIDMVVECVLTGIVGDNKLVKKHKDRLMVSLYSPRERYAVWLAPRGAARTRRTRTTMMSSRVH